MYLNTPELSTTLTHLRPYYVFINYCIQFLVKFQDIYDPISFKQLVVDTKVNNCKHSALYKL